MKIEENAPSGVIPLPTEVIAAKGHSFEKTEVCPVCGLPWKESQFRTYKGRRYGVPCGCYGDIEQLILGRQ